MLLEESLLAMYMLKSYCTALKMVVLTLGHELEEVSPLLAIQSFDSGKAFLFYLIEKDQVLGQGHGQAHDQEQDEID